MKIDEEKNEIEIILRKAIYDKNAVALGIQAFKDVCEFNLHEDFYVFVHTKIPILRIIIKPKELLKKKELERVGLEFCNCLLQFQQKFKADSKIN